MGGESKPIVKAHDLLEELAHTVTRLMLETTDKFGGFIVLIEG
jgi:hypothetical protein